MILDILRRDHAVLDALQGRWPKAFAVDYGDYEIPAESRPEAERIALEVRAVVNGRSGDWSVEIETADKRIFLVGGEQHDYYVLVTAAWKPLPNKW